MEIIPFAHRFVGDIASLIVSIQRDEFGIDITYEDQPDLGDIPGFYQTGAGQFWLAMEQQRVIGTIALRDIGDGAGALRKMFVDHAFRGPEPGAAAMLLSTLVNHATEKGLQVIYLGTTDKFVAAHRFYEKNGFERIAPGDLPPSFPRMKVDTRFYQAGWFVRIGSFRHCERSEAINDPVRTRRMDCFAPLAIVQVH